jgi:hypothetical protein
MLTHCEWRVCMIGGCDLSTGPEGVDEMVREKGKGDSEEGGNCSSLRDTEMAAPRTSHARYRPSEKFLSAHAKHMLWVMLEQPHSDFHDRRDTQICRSQKTDK